MKSMKSTKNKIFSFVRRTKDLKQRFFAEAEDLEEPRQPTFSSYFLKFFQCMTLWELKDLWQHSIGGIINYSQCNSICLFYSNYPKTIHQGKKSRLKDSEAVYRVFVQSCCYLVKMDVGLMLKTFFQVNEENQHLKVGIYERLTQDLESIHFMEGLNKIIRKRPKTKSEKILFVLKRSINYLKADFNSEILNLCLLNKQAKKALKKKILKQFLKMKITNKKIRILIWNKIAKTRTISRKLTKINQSKSGPVNFSGH